MRDPEEARKKFENKFLNDLSKHQHAEDVRHNPRDDANDFKPWFRRKQDDNQHPKSAEFERRHRS